MAPSEWYTVAVIVLAIIGIVMMLRGLIGKLVSGTTCASCGYDLAGLSSNVCPECGDADAGRLRRRRSIKVALLSLLLFVPVVTWYRWRPQIRKLYWSIRYPAWKVQEEQVFGPVALRRLAGGRPDNEVANGYEVLYNGKLCIRETDFRRAHVPEEFDLKQLPYPGVDLTGDGIPEFIVITSSGGAHCCYDAIIFDFAKGEVPIARIKGQHTEPHFQDRDGGHEIRVRDWTFAYWRTSFTSSPAPTVLLKWNDGRFVPDVTLMSNPAPSDAELDAESEFFRTTARGTASPGNELPVPALWGLMLDLMYSGNVRAAWRLYDGAWRPGESGKDEFQKQFLAELGHSPYWADIFGQLPKEEREAMR